MLGERTGKDMEQWKRNKNENVCVCVGGVYPQMGKESYKTSEGKQPRRKEQTVTAKRPNPELKAQTQDLLPISESVSRTKKETTLIGIVSERKNTKQNPGKKVFVRYW